MLKGEDNLAEQKILLRGNLELHGLLDFIDKDVPEPQTATDKKEQNQNRAVTNLLIKASLIQKETNQTLINNGWNTEEKNPKKTYDLVLKAIPKISEDTVGILIAEFVRIERKQFDLFDKFLIRL